MKRILYVWKGPYPWDVRAEKVCKALGSNGYEVIMLTRWDKGQKEIEEFDYFTVHRLGVDKPFKYTLPVSANPYWKYFLKQSVEYYKPSIVMPREIMLATVSAKTAHKKELPVIIDMAEHYPAAMKGWQKYSQKPINHLMVHKLNIPERVEQRAVKHADGIITVCEEQNIRLMNEYGFASNKIQVVHNSPELNWFEGVRAGSTKPPLIFAYHGYFSDDRNLDKMIQGFIIAAKKSPDIKLVIAGTGESEDVFHRIADESGLGNRIQFIGEYKHTQIKQLYSEMDVGILPYKANTFINHTISNKLFDYLGAGKPVIVSKALPMMRIINETQCGIIADCESEIEIAEAIGKISESDFDRIKESGQKVVREKYNWDVDVRNLLDFLKKFL